MAATSRGTMTNKSDEMQVLLDRLTKELVDQGKLIEAGFVALKLAAVDRHAPPIQLQEMRLAYLAGAQHLFFSIMGILEPGLEPTEKDLQRMDLIHRELEAATVELKAWTER
jgi:hypothetical protein